MKADLVNADVHPVFVVGHPYSGTTLVQLLIAAHPAVSSGPETHFFRYVLQPIESWRESRLSRGQLDVVFDRLAAKPAIELGDRIKREIRRKGGTDGIAPADLLDELMRHFAREAGMESRRWVEKTPRHADYIPEILALFPNAKIVNVVRDPRDVVSSAVRYASFDSDKEQRSYCAARAERWNREVGEALKLALVHRRAMTTIRYEDIVETASASLKEIMQFLGEEYHQESLDSFSQNYESVIVPKEDEHKSLASVGRILDRRGIWRTRMSKDDARVVELICSDLMGEFGYTLREPFTLCERMKKTIMLCPLLHSPRQALLETTKRLLAALTGDSDRESGASEYGTT